MFYIILIETNPSNIKVSFIFQNHFRRHMDTLTQLRVIISRKNVFPDSKSQSVLSRFTISCEHGFLELSEMFQISSSEKIV